MHRAVRFPVPTLARLNCSAAMIRVAPLLAPALAIIPQVGRISCATGRFKAAVLGRINPCPVLPDQELRLDHTEARAQGAAGMC